MSIRIRTAGSVLIANQTAALLTLLALWRKCGSRKRSRAIGRISRWAAPDLFVAQCYFESEAQHPRLSASPPPWQALRRASEGSLCRGNLTPFCLKIILGVERTNHSRQSRKSVRLLDEITGHH